ncbi:MAG: chromosome segregation protein SMC [Fimbriimonas sp.]
MRLKRVRIFGFKTFADKTEFELPGGLVAVVGPNGCGKSNLVDAILWGLGEGNSRQLRAAHSQDVIFGGSPGRKGVGFAEVSLLFDNEDGQLPVETPEVSVTRRLTRSGESEYSINRQSCRLRDVHELLADSGLGRSGYAIVGQKEIDQALAASAEDRRAWVDEAAGIQRYRARKQESQRRLGQAIGHLTRVEDILRELEVQREPLRAEAEDATRYRSILHSLQEVELGMLIEEVASAAELSAALETRLAETSKLVASELKRADDLDEDVKRAGERISELEREMDAVRALRQSSITNWERCDAALRLAQQRLASLDELEKSLRDDAESGTARLAEAERERLLAREDVSRELLALDKLREDLDGASQGARAIRAALANAERELAEARKIEEERLKQKAEAKHRAERVRLAQRELDGAKRDLPDLDEALAEATTQFESAANADKKLIEEIKQIEVASLALRQEEERDAKSVRASLGERASLEGRRRGIELTIESHEGLNQGSRSVMEAADRNILKGRYTPVGEAVETDKDLALAIETALGGAVNDLIVEHESDAKVAIQWLKDNRAGRATFQPIPFMRPSEVSRDMQQRLAERGVVGRASALVRTERAFLPVIESLLGRVIIVETLEDALRMAKTPGWNRLVTLDGEVIHSGGGVTGGRQSKQGYGLVQRKADLLELEDQIASLDKTVKEFESRSAKRTRQGEENAKKVAAMRADLDEQAKATKDARDFLQTLTEERKSAQRECDRLEREISSLTQVHVADLEPTDIPGLESLRDAHMKDLAQRAAESEGAEEALKAADFRLQQARTRLEAADRRHKLASEAESSREKKLASLEPERARSRAEIEQQEAGKTQAKAQRETSEVRLQDLQRTKREQLEQSLAQVDEAKAARANAASLGDVAHQAELNRARADAKKANALQRLLDDYGMGEEEAIANRGVHLVPDDATTVVNRLRRDLKAMGDVNLGAIEAFDRLTARFDELNVQHQDIRGGIDQIEASILELDKLCRERFLTTFSQVEAAYSQMYQRLFNGGVGRLVLSDHTNVLESGIDIDVTLPGKKQQRLELLSGGERALCAMAFLFALLDTKPSPLVVLDEVDAPLDGRNVERFADLLLDFSSRMQFIVITHNPTTVERAPVWLGVTMQTPGVSTLVPTRRPESKQQDPPPLEG